MKEQQFSRNTRHTTYYLVYTRFHTIPFKKITQAIRFVEKYKTTRKKEMASASYKRVQADQLKPKIKKVTVEDIPI